MELQGWHNKDNTIYIFSSFLSSSRSVFFLSSSSSISVLFLVTSLLLYSWFPCSPLLTKYCTVTQVAAKQLMYRPDPLNMWVAGNMLPATNCFVASGYIWSETTTFNISMAKPKYNDEVISPVFSRTVKGHYNISKILRTFIYYSFLYIEFHVARMQAKFPRICPDHTTGWVGLD